MEIWGGGGTGNNICYRADCSFFGLTIEIFGLGGSKDNPGPYLTDIFGPAGLKLARTKYFVTDPQEIKKNIIIYFYTNTEGRA